MTNKPQRLQDYLQHIEVACDLVRSHEVGIL